MARATSDLADEVSRRSLIASLSAPVSLKWQAPMEPVVSSLLVGTAIGGFAWAAGDAVNAGLDWAADDIQKQLRRLRIHAPQTKSILGVWWATLLASYVVLWLLFDQPILGGLLIAILSVGPWYLIRRWAQRRREMIEDQLADSMVSLSSAIRAGLSLAQALEILAKQSPRPICQEFSQIVGEYGLGKPLEKCLDEARARLRSENFALFSAAMQASRESGGKLNETVERIAISVREMQRLERKVQADTAQARTSATYMALVPFVVLALYYFVLDPVNTERLFTTVVGQLMLCVALILNVIAYLWARKILNPDI